MYKVLIALIGNVISSLWIITMSVAHPYYNLRPVIEASDTIVIEGKVLDSETKSPIKALLSYERIPTRDDIGLFYSDSATGNYQLVLKDSSKYKLTIQANNYITSFKVLEFPSPEIAIDLQEILLVPLKVGQVIVMDQIVFQRGKDKILAESFPDLDNIYKMLSENPKMEIQLEGHTDNVGSSSANLKLSEGRVNAVRNYLVKKGIKKNRIEVKAFGGSKPVANNSTEEGRQKNRRVEIRILRN